MLTLGRANLPQGGDMLFAWWLLSGCVDLVMCLSSLARLHGQTDALVRLSNSYLKIGNVFFSCLGMMRGLILIVN